MQVRAEGTKKKRSNNLVCNSGCIDMSKIAAFWARRTGIRRVGNTTPAGSSATTGTGAT